MMRPYHREACDAIGRAIRDRKQVMPPAMATGIRLLPPPTPDHGILNTNEKQTCPAAGRRIADIEEE
ncbi:hypothetical protein [Methanocalculus chunghsingensis]|nr:hypothetical protein [Methanocalculus chunghsingensis]